MRIFHTGFMLKYITKYVLAGLNSYWFYNTRMHSHTYIILKRGLHTHAHTHTERDIAPW